MNKPGNTPMNEYEIATFALGASWKVEAVFRNKARGIIATATGYTGDEVHYPRLERETKEKKRLVQAVQIVFDPKIAPYEKLLELFWELHDPAYALKAEEKKDHHTSIIYCHSEKQKEKAIISKRRFERSGKFKDQINVHILPAPHFFKEEKEIPRDDHNIGKRTGINKNFPKKNLQHQAR
ncbi:MAG: peptide-methionine (S)-S-oxide reductase [Methanomethylovorans sp.]|uniref:peptide-methionine (S)-S-oxide reductase n=1 Tax=Methanomethylovorans sp. TaxID=2758717 RepID=UPI000A4D76EA|nr:peptide-methionine (S)-S-oxide reductase [Methanomethylovorans sp.]